MTPVTSFSGKSVALFGLGGSGLATALALTAGGASVAAWDDGAAGRDKAQAAGIALLDLKDADFTRFCALVLAPGVPLTHPAPHWSVAKAKEAGIPIIGDVELFCRERAATAPDAPFVAITGTNGKSTTTALIAHVLRQAGLDVQMGGNIGTPVLALEPPSENRVHVIEMSSFQIDLTPSLMPTVGVLLNITPDHLDRHGTMENYAAIKERLVEGADTAVIGIDDEPCRAIAHRLMEMGRNVVRISVEKAPVPGIYVEDGVIYRDGADGIEPAARLAGIGSLRGAHNGQNAAAAFVVASQLGIDDDTIAEGFASFPGLAHRLQTVGHLGPVIFVNDSKATNADSTQKALTSFPEAIHWIVGGKAKEGGIAPLAPHFAQVAKAYLIGEASEAFAATLEGRVPYERCGTLDVAVAAAARDVAQSQAKEPVVLLSPACASYDQFPNFEVRGHHFRSLVSALPGVTMTA